MTAPEPLWEQEFEGAPPPGSPVADSLLEMHGRVSAVRITHYPGIALPHIELWTERPGTESCDPDAVAYHYFNAFPPIRQDQTDAEWLELLTSGVTTMLHPAAEPEEKPAP